MLFITIEITGPVEITRAERHQRVNLPLPILGGMFILHFWQCFLPDLCPKSPFQLRRRDACVQVRLGNMFSLRLSAKDSHGVRNPLMTRNQPAMQEIRSARFSFLPVHSPAQQHTWKSAEELCLPGLQRL